MQWSSNTRAIVASDLHSASPNWVFWNSIIFLPKASRCLTYSIALNHGLGMNRDDETLARKIVHELREALAFLSTEQVLRRQLHVLEEQFRGVGGIEAELLE